MTWPSLCEGYNNIIIIYALYDLVWVLVFMHGCSILSFFYNQTCILYSGHCVRQPPPYYSHLSSIHYTPL